VRNLRHFFQRGEVTEQELRTLHGVVTELALGRRQRGRLENDLDEPRLVSARDDGIEPPRGDIAS
jgi:hypothetical protein